MSACARGSYIHTPTTRSSHSHTNLLTHLHTTWGARQQRRIPQPQWNRVLSLNYYITPADASVVSLPNIINLVRQPASLGPSSRLAPQTSYSSTSLATSCHLAPSGPDERRRRLRGRATYRPRITDTDVSLLRFRDDVADRLCKIAQVSLEFPPPPPPPLPFCPLPPSLNHRRTDETKAKSIQ